MIKREDFINRCWQLPYAYEDLCRGLYEFSSEHGCCDEVYNFMMSHPDCTSDEVYCFYFDCIGGLPDAIKIVDSDNNVSEKLVG